jgi:hypothetical protein
MIVKLTPDFIAHSLRCPEGRRRIEYVDAGGVGLYVEVRATSPGQRLHPSARTDMGEPAVTRAPTPAHRPRSAPLSGSSGPGMAPLPWGEPWRHLRAHGSAIGSRRGGIRAKRVLRINSDVMRP